MIQGFQPDIITRQEPAAPPAPPVVAAPVSFPKRPRKFLVRPRVSIKRWMIRLMTLPMAALFLAFLFGVAFSIMMSATGTISDAEITSADRENDGRSMRYIVRYEYESGGRKWKGVGNVSQHDFDEIRTLLGQYQRPTTKVQHLELGQMHQSQLLNGSGTHGIGGQFMLALFFLTATGFMVRSGWLDLRRDAFLCIHGTATAGSLRHITTSAAVRWFPRLLAHVSFVDQHNRTWHRTIRIPKPGRIHNLQPGDSITVLFHPANPAYCAIYEALDMKILGVVPLPASDPAAVPEIHG